MNSKWLTGAVLRTYGICSLAVCLVGLLANGVAPMVPGELMLMLWAGLCLAKQGDQRLRRNAKIVFILMSVTLVLSVLFVLADNFNLWR